MFFVWPRLSVKPRAFNFNRITHSKHTACMSHCPLCLQWVAQLENESMCLKMTSHKCAANEQKIHLKHFRSKHFFALSTSCRGRWIVCAKLPLVAVDWRDWSKETKGFPSFLSLWRPRTVLSIHAGMATQRQRIQALGRTRYAVCLLSCWNWMLWVYPTIWLQKNFESFSYGRTLDSPSPETVHKIALKIALTQKHLTVQDWKRVDAERNSMILSKNGPSMFVRTSRNIRKIWNWRPQSLQ